MWGCREVCWGVGCVRKCVGEVWESVGGGMGKCFGVWGSVGGGGKVLGEVWER